MKKIFRVHRIFEVSGSHHLKLPYKSNCTRLHGHNWIIEVWVTGPLDENGMVVDFTKLKEVVMKLDHQDINKFVPQPTAELMSLYLVEEIKKLFENPDDYKVRVKIFETKDSDVEGPIDED